ncbi:MAG: hypothetical protein WAX37_00685 [Minisyncoccia bacterium]
MTKKIKSFLINHYHIVLLALLVGVLSSLPQYIEKSTRENFAGIHAGVVKDTGYYMARTKDVMDGHPYVTNPYIYEHKDGVPVEFWIPDVIIAKPIQWLGISVGTGYIIWTFILTTILSLLSYVVLYLLTKSKPLSLYGVIIIHIGMFGLKFMRLPSPGLNFIFYLLAFLILILFIQQRRKSYLVLSAIAFGLLFNVYTYYWTFYVVIFAVFITLAFIFRIKDFPYKKYFLIFGGGLVIGIPYFISMWKSLNLPGHSETLARIGLIHTHFPSGIFPVFVAGIVIMVFALFYYKKIVNISHLSLFLFSGVLSTIIVINQHLITGINLEFSSHYLLGNMYWCIITLIYLLSLWLIERPDNLRKKVIIGFGVMVVVYGSFGLSNIIEQQVIFRESEVYIQNYKSIFDWLNKNAKPDDVVFTNDEIGDYIPIYTGENVYFEYASVLYYMTNDEVLQRFIINHYFDKFTPEYILLKQRHIFGGYYLNEYGHNLSKNKLRKLFGLPQIKYEMVPNSEVQRIELLAEEIQKESFIKELKTYRADYIVWDSIKNPNWKIKDQRFFKEVYSSNGIFIFSINS